MIGYRKFLLCLVAMLLVFIGIMFGKIEGDTGVTGIVTILGISLGGYGLEYWKNKENK